MSNAAATIAIMQALATTLVLSAIIPDCSQSFITLPSAGCDSSHWCSAFELLEKQKADKSRKGVVGTNGNTMPTIPQRQANKPVSMYIDRYSCVCIVLLSQYRIKPLHVHGFSRLYHSSTVLQHCITIACGKTGQYAWTLWTSRVDYQLTIVIPVTDCALIVSSARFLFKLIFRNGSNGNFTFRCTAG